MFQPSNSENRLIVLNEEFLDFGFQESMTFSGEK
jgi:hypothetical protein